MLLWSIYWHELTLSGLYNRFVKDSKLSFVNGEVVDFEACLKISDKVENITLLQKRTYNFTSQDSIKVHLAFGFLGSTRLIV